MYCGAEICAKNIRFRFTFGFFAVWALLMAFGTGSYIARLTMLSCALHELAHIAAMKLSGARLRQMLFYGGGVAITSEPPIEYIGLKRELFILLAGCAANFAAAAVLAAAGSELPAAVNAALGLFNLMPLSQLDGGRIISALFSAKLPLADIRTAQRICDILLGAPAAVFLILRGNVNFTLPLTLAMIMLEGVVERPHDLL